MTLVVGGIDMTPYIAYGGFKWQRFDLDGENAGRVLSGETERDRIAIKTRLDLTCKPLTLAEAHKVLYTIEPVFVSVRYTDPSAGRDVTKMMYSNNIPANFLMRQRDGTELWGGITFPLIEK